ncbi:hypothetical protein COU23_03560 [Candidatus Kuenenbacteria bacterium CG10_big_fil_rev_8_21_14_0_10_36_11]|uniref:Methyltransferase type 11 domain-containing protein n=1 Tax=Candidatus Kuenenbacteria bacterium CG10_big_fil_rev_8_21_14_0_10_36_11 TaxID=1974618 RepID=A0A2M6W9U0_9BACT|nr:MAG: hypothetical protein COU23_03560 [Candidatus Kuenenbacteria bacterium CG10_big_fil_rev_8_21_14_0_10_36_11]
MNSETAKKLIELNQNSYSQIAKVFSDSRNFPWHEIKNVVRKYVKPCDKILDLGCGNGRLLKSLEKLKNFSYTGLDNCSSLIEKAQAIFLSSDISCSSFPNSLLSFPRVQICQWQIERESRNIIFINDNILNLDQFNSNEFDIIFMMASFHHIPSQELREKLLQDIKRILKPNGFLIMTNWNLWQIGAKKNVWTSLLSSLLSLLSSSRKRGSRLINTRSQIRSEMAIKDIITLWQNQFPLYYHAFTKRELKKLLQKTNFEVLENYYVKQGQKARWWNGYNILTVAKKIIV